MEPVKRISALTHSRLSGNEGEFQRWTAMDFYKIRWSVSLSLSHFFMPVFLSLLSYLSKVLDFLERPHSEENRVRVSLTLRKGGI